MKVVVAALILVWVPLTASVARADLVAFYPLNGNADDASGNGNHGTVSGATPTPSGFEGFAFDFDGINDFIEVPVDFNPAVRPLLTIGGWANSDVASSIRAVLSHDDNIPASTSFDRHIGFDTRGVTGGGTPEWAAFTGSGVLASGVDVVPGEWVFIAAVFDQSAGVVRLHVDDQVTVGAGVYGSGFTIARIGSNPRNGGNEFFDGRIDNIFIYDEALTDSQIENIRLQGMSAILPPSVPALSAWGSLALAGLLLCVGVLDTGALYVRRFRGVGESP